MIIIEQEGGNDVAYIHLCDIQKFYELSHKHENEDIERALKYNKVPRNSKGLYKYREAISMPVKDGFFIDEKEEMLDINSEVKAIKILKEVGIHCFTPKQALNFLLNLHIPYSFDIEELKEALGDVDTMRDKVENGMEYNMVLKNQKQLPPYYPENFRETKGRFF